MEARKVFQCLLALEKSQEIHRTVLYNPPLDSLCFFIYNCTKRDGGQTQGRTSCLGWDMS